MLDFSAKQKKYVIHSVEIGGNPGERPTVMVGTIFYKKHSIVRDSKKGLFDERRGEELLKHLEEMSDKTGLPSMLDVVGETSEATQKYLDFICDNTEMPIFLDTLSTKTCIESLDYVRQVGILDRIVVNSLTFHTSDEIYKKIRDTGTKSAVLLLYSAGSIISSHERIKLLNELVPKAEESGIEKILVDTAVLDIPTLGLAVKALYDIKDKFGYPTGCGAHNAVEGWRGLKTKFVESAMWSCASVANALPVALGGDFILYGPIESASYVYPSVALINAAYGQISIEKGRRPSKEHPRHKIS